MLIFAILFCVNWKGFAHSQDFLFLLAALEKYF